MSTRDERDRSSKREETAEERRARKEREHAEKKARRKREAEEAEKVERAEKAEKAEKSDRGEKSERSEKSEKKTETEEERRARKERERAARRAKRASEAAAEESPAADSAPPPPPSAHDDLLAAIAEENRAVSRSALRSREAEARGARLGSAGEDPEAAARREERKREQREERRRRKARGPGEEEGAEGTMDEARAPLSPSPAAGDAATALRRQGYRGQFTKDLARATALRRLVDLDDTAALLVDLSPQTEYDRYLRTFAESGRRQVVVQVPEEETRGEAASQTERARTRARGGQVPDDLGLYPEQYADRIGFGAGVEDEAGADASTGAGRDEDKGEGEPAARSSVPSVDVALLGAFFARVLPVMSSIMDENLAEGPGGAAQGVEAKARAVSPAAESFSAGCTTLAFEPVRGRPILQTRFSPITSQSIAALHGASQAGEDDGPLAVYPAVVLLWSVFQTAAPERVLVSFSPLTCICFSPTRPHLLYAGAEDGTVCLWDLREPDRSHLSVGARVGCYGAAPRLPSFTTAWRADNHTAAVRDLCVAGTGTAGARSGGSGVDPGARRGAGSSAAEQLLSLDLRGELRVWAVGDREAPSRATAVSTGEHGLHLFSTTRLTLAGVLTAAAAGDLEDAAGSVPTRRGAIARAHAHDSGSDDEVSSGSDTDAYGVPGRVGVAGAGGEPGLEACLRMPCAAASRGCSLDVCPTDAARYVVAAAGGVRHRNRFGAVTAPALYGGADAALGGTVADLGLGPAVRSAALPTCVRYSTRDSRLLLAGYDDGTVRLFLQQQAAPQLVVAVSPAAAPVVEVRPVSSVPWLTWVLDDGGCLYLLDHAHLQQRGTARLVVPLGTPEMGACLCLDVPQEEKALDGGLLAVGFGKGVLQVHNVDARKVLAPPRERDERWL